MNIQKDEVVTVNLPTGTNTFIIDTVEEDSVLVKHPLSGELLLRVSKKNLNRTNANVKDSTERCIDYANANKKFLDYNTSGDLESVGIYFVLKRKLTPRQKQTLANICGVIASVKFDNDLQKAMDYVMENEGILDQFNLMWFNNFKRLFSGHQPITSKKQRNAIFNIAGYALAELENPTAPKQK